MTCESCQQDQIDWGLLPLNMEGHLEKGLEEFDQDAYKPGVPERG